ncbi:1-acyl-sn-glycerol-3-phosphate acyltransferase [Ideonella sp. 4Y16]|uniref:lysophospholipid acyltransferase family protein n=1 Tax=Ideonella alba TaxID=2824118 RepID=UPI001B3687E9|nr:lysophospholipid acyltransferase family protein [Ideonella alba]MBQ0945273.1 1-acyl-sn-glycerol-3-phosphate acyltransferase [Ideonella alba]
MPALRALGRSVGLVLHVLHGMLLMALLWRRLDESGRQQRIQWWSAKLLRRAGLTLTVRGAPRPGGALLVANHVSWLDIAAIHAACPQARFVSKADVKRWPLLGWLIAGAGTLFIERERKRDAMRMVHEMAAALQRGETVAVFPEGTTGAGATVLPFHANLLQAAIAVAAPIQPVALRFAEPGQPFSVAAQYIGDTTLLQSLWRVLAAQGLSVDVDFLPPQASAHAERRALAAALQQQIQQRLDEQVV